MERMPDRKQVLVVILLLSTGFLIASAEIWPRFIKPGGFSVLYPPNWFRVGLSKDRLQLLSSAGGAKGVVIKDRQAEITVIEADAAPGKTLAQVITYYTEDTSVISQQELPMEPYGRGCATLIEVVSREQPVPQADTPIKVRDIINTDFFCVAGAHTIVTLLRNWEGDNRQAEYQEVAVRMARSIMPVQ
jgi:hypothetical protein